MRERTTSTPDRGEMVQEGAPEEEELGTYQRDSIGLARTRFGREGEFCTPVASLVLIKHTLHRPARCTGSARYPSAISEQRLHAASDVVSPDPDESTHFASGVRPLAQI